MGELDDDRIFSDSLKLLINNLFLTSKIEFSNSPIYEIKVLHKSQRPF